MSLLYHHFIEMQRVQTKGEFLRAGKDKSCIFSTETLQWEGKRRILKLVF